MRKGFNSINTVKRLVVILFVSFAVVSTLTAAYTPLNLRKYVNMAFRDEKEGDEEGGWSDQGANDMRNLPVGMTNYHGVPFDIIDPAKNTIKSNKSCIVLYGNPKPFFPKLVRIKVERSASVIYFAHTHAWGAPAAMATYEVVYKSKRIPQQNIKVFMKDNIASFWDPKQGARCEVAWSGENPVHGPVGFGITAWKNPYPDEEILGIRLRSQETDGIVIVLGITLSDEEDPVKLGSRFQEKKVRTRREPDMSRFTQINFDTMNYDDRELEGFHLAKSHPDLYHKPAGKYGYIQSKDDKLVFEKTGKEFKVWGVGIAPSDATPDADTAKHEAYRLTQMGVNGVRIHPVDGILLKLDRKKDNWSLDGFDWDAHDRFIATLIENGIYIKYSILYALSFVNGEGIPQYKELNENQLVKTAFFLDERLENKYKEFLTTWLGHMNPYRRRTYAEDPGIFMMQAVNENNLFFYHVDTLPSYYKNLFDEKWQAWLLSKYGNTAALARAWKGRLRSFESLEKGTIMRYTIGKISRLVNKENAPGMFQRQKDQYLFYYELQDRFFKSIEQHIRSLGFKGVYSGTAWHGAGVARAVDKIHEGSFDISDTHEYFGGDGSWNIIHCKSEFDPLTKLPVRSQGLPIKMKNNHVNTPTSLSEWAIGLPTDYMSDAIPLVAGYGQLQGLDVSFIFELIDSVSWAGVLNNKLNLTCHPGDFGQLHLGSLMMVRQDIQEGPVIFKKVVSKKALENNFEDIDYFPAGNVSGASIKSGDANVTKYLVKQKGGAADEGPQIDPYFAIGRGGYSYEEEAEKIINDMSNMPEDLDKYFDRENKIIRSMTGELTWDYGKGVVKFDAPRLQGATGWLERTHLDFKSIEIKSLTEYHAYFVVSLDKKPISESKKLLVSSIGRMYNTGMKYNPKTLMLEDLGSSPMLAERGIMQLKIKNRGNEEAKVYPLNTVGDKVLKYGEVFEWGDRYSEDNDFYVITGTAEEPYIYYLIEFE